MTWEIHQGDARRLPLEDGTVDLVVTSPPYFALRSYTDDGEQLAAKVRGRFWADRQQTFDFAVEGGA